MWSVSASHYPLKDQWISVRAETCLTSLGVELNTYYTLEYPDFVHVLAITADHQIVLTRQYRHGFGAAVIELPGGVANAGDTSILATGLRELAEETGFTSENAVTMSPLSLDPAKFRNRLHLVLAHHAVQNRALELDPAEEIEVVLASVGECLDMVRKGLFVNAAHVGMLVMGLERAGLLTIGE